MPPAKTRSLPTWSTGEKTLAGFLVTGGVAITIPAFVELYRTSTAVVRPWFGQWAWTVPVSGEIAWCVVYGLGVLLAMRKVTGSPARAAFQTVLVAGSITIQVYAGHGIVPATVGHVLVVAAFFGTLLAGKGTITRIRRGDTPPDRLTIGEWITHPAQCAALFRRMMAWGETSKSRARVRYAAELYAIALAQSDPRIGRTPVLWRRRLPVTLRFQLTAGLWPADVEAIVTDLAAPAGAWQGPLSLHVSRQLSLLDPLQPDDTVSDTADGTADGTAPAVKTAAARGTKTAAGSGSGDWPSARGIPHADLIRRTRTALTRWEKDHPGERLPAVQLPALLRLRMARETAGKLLDEARPAPERPRLVR